MFDDFLNHYYAGGLIVAMILLTVAQYAFFIYLFIWCLFFIGNAINKFIYNGETEEELQKRRSQELENIRNYYNKQ